MVAAIERDYPQMEIADAAFHFQRQVERGEKIVLGVNKYPSERPELEFVLKIDEELERSQVERTRRFKESRDKVKFTAAMDELRRRCEGPPCWDNNVMPALIDAVRAGATEQECCDLYREVFGTYSDPARFRTPGEAYRPGAGSMNPTPGIGWEVAFSCIQRENCAY